MIRRILVPVDGSASARAALSIGASLGGILQSEVVGLFVEDEAAFRRLPLATAIVDGLVGEPLMYEPLEPEEMLAAEERTDAERKQLRSEFESICAKASIDGKFTAVRGNPATVMSDVARSVDLIVMGNSGKHAGVEGVEPGVTTNALLHLTTRPVLVVPDQAQGQSRMVIAYDGSVSADRMLRVAAEFAHITEMLDVHLVTVSTDTTEAVRQQESVKDYLGAYDLSVTTKVLTGKPHEAIAKYCDEIDASIVAIGAFGSNRFMERIFGSTASHLLHSVDAAVLLVQ